MTAILPLHQEEVEGRVLLFALDRPGCWAEGGSEAEALANVPAAVAASAAWIDAHGETPPAPPGDPRVVQRVAARVLADGYEVNALFGPERRPPDRALLARDVRLLHHAGSDLLAAIEAIPPDRRDAASADERSPRQIVEHVAEAELWYLRHFEDTPVELVSDHPPDAAARFATVHAALVGWLSRAAPASLAMVTVEREEAWSVRKLLRRALWHARTHTAELRSRE